MAFYYINNSNMNPLGTMGQMSAYLNNYSQFYPKNEDYTCGSFYSWPWAQMSVFAQTEHCATRTTSIIVDEAQNEAQATPSTSHKKRRAQKTLEKEIISAKKNSESNLINQFYSFFGSREKSQKVVQKCCSLLSKTQEETDKILPLFYNSIRYINAKRGRKYVNAALLVKFFTPEEFAAYLPEFQDKVGSSGVLTLSELCEIFRRCTMYFLKNVSVSAILTSKRISLVSKQEHLKKRRKVQRTVLEH